MGNLNILIALSIVACYEGILELLCMTEFCTTHCSFSRVTIFLICHIGCSKFQDTFTWVTLFVSVLVNELGHCASLWLKATRTHNYRCTIFVNNFYFILRQLENCVPFAFLWSNIIFDSLRYLSLLLILSKNFIFVVPCIVILGWRNPTRCYSMQKFIYCYITLHVSGVHRAHHQEYIKL